MSGFRSMSGAIKAHKKAGGHFFDKDTMEHFSSQIFHDTYEPKTGMFITSEIVWDERDYTVRCIDLDNPKRIENIGESQPTLQAAQAVLRESLSLA